ncbi:histidine phosphatase family protein [Alkalihalobacillus sp. R86527]|uniref:histidine phosphatase family protein n=1 Tax=Alkalihalobacillus sp. R86527 TaxID=3093863 RepID=UPI00366B577A
MPTVGLVRHGVTEWNSLGKAQGHSNISLNQEGKNQALKLAERLSKEEPWDVIITSDLSRAKETAEIIASRLPHTPIIEQPSIREMHGGEIEGTTEAERVAKWGEDWRNKELGMEKRQDVAQRGGAFLEELTSAYKGKRVLVVSHGAWIGITLEYLFPEEYFYAFLENTSLSIIQKSDQGWRNVLFNCISHL